MSLSTGTRLGTYEILGPIGAGGMGEVYRAHDTRLKRDVALKVLPEAFAQDTERMLRFEREAQVLAALNHPNIAAVYGIEERAIVMELVEGATLAGPFPIDTALDYARQIALALEAAHEKGIVHRDLKPANVKVTADGVVKVLDFGLAKLSEDPSAAVEGTNSPTRTMSPTRAGWILGTAAYMSPEQARGSPVDKRADIWAFGVVLYEMLTGRHSFVGETVSDTLAAVLKTDPDWSVLPAETPQPIRRLLRRCLERDRKRRLPDIAVARLEIDEALAGAPEAPVVAAPARQGILRWWIAAPMLLALAGVALAIVHFREQAPERAVVRFQIPAPEKNTFSETITLSPDGRRLAFTATNAGGVPMVWVRDLDTLEAHALPGTEGARHTFWSPDGRSLGFFVQGKVRKVGASGGPPQTLCEVTGNPIGGSWSRLGTILFGMQNTGLFRVSQAGGSAAPLTTPDAERGEITHLRPWFLPDGTHFLYIAVNTDPQKSTIYLASLDSKDRKQLVHSMQTAVYASPSAGSDKGHLLFLREDTLMAQVIDLRRFELAGEAFPVAERVGTFRAVGFFSISDNGVLAYRTGGGAGDRVAWFDREGKFRGFLGPPGLYSAVALSPDAQHAAVARGEPQSTNSDIWLLDSARASRFTFDPARESNPVWSPNGSRLTFASARSGFDNIYQQDAGSAGNEQPLFKMGAQALPCDWSLDGRYILYTSLGAKTRADLWILPAGPVTEGAQRNPEPYLQTPFSESQGQFSPDSHWVAYSSDAPGTTQIYVQSFPAGNGTFQISTAGGVQPRWRKNGKELFFIAPDGKLMAVDVKIGSKFEFGTPKALFDSKIRGGGNVSTSFRYDVAADGKRFLIITSGDPTDAAVSAPITVVLNWTAGLKR